MIRLDYDFEPADFRDIAQVDLATAELPQLDTYLFRGRLIFRIDDTSFDTPWWWVPILGFAAELHSVISDLPKGATRSIEFIGSEAAITFRRGTDDVEVISNYGELADEYVSARATTSLQELQEAVTAFVVRLQDDVSKRWPALKRNAAFRTMFANMR